MNNNDKKRENKLLLVLAIIFTTLIVVVTAIVFLLPKLTEVKNIVVPDVAGMSLTDAENELINAGFNIASETKDATSKDVEEGNIVKTSPSAGSIRKEGATVTLYISVGEGGYILEDLTGKNYIEQKVLLENMHGLFVEIIEEELDNPTKYEKNSILSTEPSAGTLLKEGDTIKLHIPDTNVIYPDFTSGDYSLKDIEAFATKYEIDLTIEYVETEQYEIGTIYKQSKQPGTVVVEGANLTIYIASELNETDDLSD